MKNRIRRVYSYREAEATGYDYIVELNRRKGGGFRKTFLIKDENYYNRLPSYNYTADIESARRTTDKGKASYTA